MTSMFGSASAQGSSNARADPDLVEIQTEQIGFLTISGHDKLKLLPQPWPSDSQPPPAASLLSIAPKKGLVAAAGPDILVIASTDRLRQAFVEEKAENNIKPYVPQATLQIPRVNQVTFSSDESCLVITAEQGGGLAIYDTNALVNGSKEPAFQIGTNGATVRQIVPNPNPSNELAHYFALVLDQGQLLLADLKARQLVNNAQGNPVFHENVASACWSRLGKQIVAGRKDGTAVQIDPQGNVKAEIPVPPELSVQIESRALGTPLTSIYWLETNDFLVVHSPQNPPQTDDMDMMDEPSDNSVLHFVRRDKANNTWGFQTLVDPSIAMISRGRVPAHHFIERLRDWPPSLEDMLIVLSTVSTDVGFLTKSKIALDPSQPVVGAFTTTMPPDSRRAGMPVSFVDDMSDTSAIGMALDLSVKENAPKPIPTEETLDASPTPLPALYVLNHEGLLRVWYIVYNESIRNKQAYPDLIAAGGPRQLDAKPSSAAASATSPPPANSFGNQSAQAASAFGSPSTNPSPFGKQPNFGSSTSAFGGTSALGKSASPWGAPPAAAPSPLAGKPAFGSTSALGSSTGTTTGFGQVGSLGMQKQSVWGTPSTTPVGPSTSGGSVFGGNASSQSPFGTVGAKKEDDPKPSPFATLNNNTASNTSPFMSMGQQNKSSDQKASPFASASNEPKPSPFGSSPDKVGQTSLSPFANLGGGPTSSQSSFASFGQPSIRVGSEDNASTPKQTLQAEPSGSTASFSSFGSIGSGNTFGQSSANGVTSFSFGKPSMSREDTTNNNSKPATPKPEVTSQFGVPSGGFKLGSTFKSDGSAATDLSKPKDVGTSLFGASFGAALGETQKSEPKIKEEPGTGEETKLSEIPLVANDKATGKSIDPLNYTPKRFAGDVPPVDVPKAEDPLDYKPKRFTGDVPPVDVPAQDPLIYKPKRFAGDVPPVDVPSQKATNGKLEDPVKEGEAPLAGSPPVDLGKPQFSPKIKAEEDDVPPVPEDDDEEDWDDDEEGEDEDEEDGEDGDEEDEGEEEEEEDDGTQTISDPAGLSSFMSRITPASPSQNGEDETDAHTPGTGKKPNFAHSGFPVAPVNFGFPSRTQESPRSPSPQRAVTSPLFSPQPGQQSFLAATSRNQAPAITRVPQRIAVAPAPVVERPATRAKVQPQVGDLEDEEDKQVRTILSQKPKPTKEVPYFLAHQNYVGNSTKEGIGGQIERVYRDINSMIDTLGLNAHSLRGFVDGHLELTKSHERERADLDEESDWVLDELSDLIIVQNNLYEDLEQGKLENVEQKKRVLFDIEKKSIQLQAKVAAIRKQLANRTDPERLKQQHTAPLPLEMQVQQSELRMAARDVLSMLAKAEDLLTQLRAELASRDAAVTKTPTVEAVINTILKMTAMIEKKSGDVDVLEAQIRRLPHGLPSVTQLNDSYEDDLVAAVRGSRLSTSSPRASTPTRPIVKRTAFNGDPLGMSGMLGSSRLRTPPAARRSVVFSPEASMLGRSGASLNGSARKRMQDVTNEEVAIYEKTKTSRKKVLDALRQSVKKNGTRIVQFEG